MGEPLRQFSDLSILVRSSYTHIEILLEELIKNSSDQMIRDSGITSNDKDVLETGS